MFEGFNVVLYVVLYQSPLYGSFYDIVRISKVVFGEKLKKIGVPVHMALSSRAIRDEAHGHENLG